MWCSRKHVAVVGPHDAYTEFLRRRQVYGGAVNGTIESAQAIAAHESPRTTKLYDRTSEDVTLDEVERIAN